jgi:hypothetical protein
VQHADSPPFSARSACATVTRIGPVWGPTLIRTRLILPFPGAARDSLALNRAPVVLKLQDGTCW